jgi:hypothetical protein
MSTPRGANATKPTYFQIQAGKLDQQVTAFIDKHDTDGDHALSLDEVREAGGLTNPTKFKSNSLAMTQSLWKAISGPSNTINAKEYAQYLILLDADQNTQITQREVDAAAWAVAEAEREAEATAKAEAKASAVAKLAALGLTEGEVAALLA